MSGNIGAIDQFIRSLTGFALIAYLGKSGEFALSAGPLLFSTVGELDGKAR